MLVSYQYDYLTTPRLILAIETASTLLYQYIENRKSSNSTALQVYIARKYPSNTLLSIFAIPKKDILLSIGRKGLLFLPTDRLVYFLKRSL